jgi:hypothetical protein
MMGDSKRKDFTKLDGQQGDKYYGKIRTENF